MLLSEGLLEAGRDALKAAYLEFHLGALPRAGMG
jgi:hypothetical protein